MCGVQCDVVFRPFCDELGVHGDERERRKKGEDGGDGLLKYVVDDTERSAGRIPSRGFLRDGDVGGTRSILSSSSSIPGQPPNQSAPYPFPNIAILSRVDSVVRSVNNPELRWAERRNAFPGPVTTEA